MIPKKAARQKDIYTAPLPASEVELRRQNYYTPYHHALQSLIRRPDPMTMRYCWIAIPCRQDYLAWIAM